MEIRLLERAEIEQIWTIDRGEIHHHLYQVQEGALVRVTAYFEISGWDPETIQKDTPLLYAGFDRGGAFIGAFEGDGLVGIAVVDTIPLGAAQDQLQLKYLYVSRPYRQLGIASRLFQQAQAVAKANGATFLYISATPTENTVNFYQRKGAFLNPTPDAELFELEPEDIHLLCPCTDHLG